MSSILLGLRLSLYDFQRVKLDNVDFDMKIDQFKSEVSKKANIQKESIELVYCGNILDDDASLNSCGLKPGVMVHVLKKKDKEAPRPSPSMTEKEIQSLVLAFRTLAPPGNPAYRNALQKISRPDILDNIITITPGLSQDPVAISMIQDPELLIRMGNIDTVRRIVELHPSLAEAANHIVAAVHAEASNVNTNTNNPTTSSGYSYSLDALSDDEMDSSQSSDSQPQGLSRNGSYSAITPAQLAAALASTSGSGSAGSSSDSSGITPEMFSLAMQRALVGSSSNSPQAFSDDNINGIESENNDLNTLEQQMQQMRELGLTDDAQNLQALQLTAGNVPAAVDLVFSGAISPNQ